MGSTLFLGPGLPSPTCSLTSGPSFPGLFAWSGVRGSALGGHAPAVPPYTVKAA